MQGFLTIGLVVTAAIVPPAGAISVEHGSLRTDGLVSPLGLANTLPRLSWRPQSSTRNDNQTAYQVQVASSPSAIESPDLWDSGKVSSADVWARYAGHNLTSRDTGFWRVRIWDVWDKPSAWSEVDSFELGLLAPSDWKAHWITNRNYIPQGGTSLPVFARTFNLSFPADKARLYLLGLGQHAAYLNGQPVSDAVLAPGYSQTNRSLPYSTYDVTSLLQHGENFLGVELGKGVYDAEKPLDKRYADFYTTDNPLTLIAQLEIACRDGPVVTVVSDESWRTSVDGPQIESAWYGGEEYDARREFPGWPTTAVDTAASSWTDASIIDGPPVNGSLTADPGPPLRIVDRWKAKSVTRINDTTWVFDLGTNFAGWYNLTMRGEAGQRVVFWPGEYLTNGLVNQSSTGRPIFDGYTFAGRSPAEWYAPRFMYHGFRYLQVDNLTHPPAASDLEALVIRADNEAVGSFQSSSQLFNAIHGIIDRAIQSNMYSVLTDCPHREKSGWLEQDHLVYEPLARGFDIQAYARRMLDIVAASQLADGMIPTTAPEFKVFLGSLSVYRDEPNWGDTMILMPLQLYRTYGEVELLEKYYDVMVAYLDYLGSKSNGTYTLDYGLGDWITFDTSTPLGITATMGYQQSAAAMATIATVLGKTDDAARFSALNQNILRAFHEKFFDTTSNSSYGSGSQASNAIALDIGAVPAEYESAVLNMLVQSLVDNGYHFTVGEIALPSLFRALQAGGRDDVLFQTMSQTTNVSYGFQVTHGATSLWEDWDGVFRTTGSLNHWMLGYGDAWLLRLAGMQQAEGSTVWSQIDFRPRVLGDLTSASAKYRTVRGWASAEWTLHGNNRTLEYRVKVPVGSTARVFLDGDSRSITEGSAGLQGRRDILGLQQENGTTVVTIGSGSYSFVVRDYSR
ncbi:hypothetical protein VTN96DRAFT_6115 [Rasamsonia emersonii]|uniref:alpha-L-rhamnosidase n=1 Tax=Rasamsonia emersonii (strain ATCC 16479 / CBS 393.64 / IMI 116815) TaxID=1408163 RepID=A0A0F4YZH2_RASE3|nr:Alpha-L-rhamnosidase [Rasamsonia emersonii CBS 393.64]KKA23667.1 Alpha-L-rhamnosidase [Rasamsonia emersonii CBS 393.64]